MKLLPALLFFGLAALTACQREAEPVAPPPSPTPIPTPNPAPGAQEAAKKLYPDLAKKDSLFNRTFREVYEDTRNKRPWLLTEIDWPLKVARRTAEMLNVEPYAPTAPAPASGTPKSTPFSSLDRGGYNQIHSSIRRGNSQKNSPPP